MMMDRLEMVREKVDRIIGDLAEDADRKFAYIHLYGVSQSATFLALTHRVNSELCAIAAMLHDIAIYALNVGHRNHAQKSAEIAQSILTEMNCFDEKEIATIVYAIAHHSDKLIRDDDIYAEILKDADVLERYFYHPDHELEEQAGVRLYYLLEALNQKRQCLKQENKEMGKR